MAGEIRSGASEMQLAAQGKLRAAGLSIGVNLFLIAIKLSVALTTGSLGVLAEVGHSTADLSASISAYWGIRRANQPPDIDHHYGHAKYENLSSLIQMAILAGITFYIFYEVAWGLYRGITIQLAGVGVGVMAFSMVIDFATARYLARRARAYGSPALEADSYHFTADFWSSVAVIIGLTAASFGVPLVDPAAALVVALVMLAAAYRLGRRSTGALLDAAPGPQLERQVREVLSAFGGFEFHSLRLRQSGSQIHMDVSLHLPAEMSVGEAHKLAHELDRSIRSAIPSVREAIIHIEPETESHLEEHRQG